MHDRPECVRKRNDRNNHTMLAKWWNTKRSAVKRGLVFELTREQFANLIAGQRCVYGNAAHDARADGMHLGLDRKDNSIGYTAGNCVPCCDRHNKMKGGWFAYENFVDALTRYPELRSCGRSNAGRKRTSSAA